MSSVHNQCMVAFLMRRVSDTNNLMAKNRSLPSLSTG